MITIEKFTDIEFWKNMNPELSITSKPFANQPSDFDISDKNSQRVVKQVIKEGHFCTDPLLPHNEVKLIADAIERIVEAGLPPAFIYVYDETWQIFRRLAKLIEPVLDHQYKITIAGMWAWHVDKNGEGFKIHRDMFAQNDMEDGRPKHLTVWIPFTDVSTLNSCMHVLPIHLDPNYPDALYKTITIDDYNHIRALPAKAGSVMGWNANIAHWGTKSSEFAKNPRISIAMDFSRADADVDADGVSYAGGPDLNAEFGDDLNYTQRLKSIGEAIDFYKTRIPDLYPELADTLFAFSKKYSISHSDKTNDTPKNKTMDDPMHSAQDRNEVNLQNNQPIKASIPSSSSDSNRLTPATKCVIRDCDGSGFAVYATEKIAANEIIEECHLVPFYQEQIKDCSTKFMIETFDYSVSSTQIEQVQVLGFAGSLRHSSNHANAVWRQRKSRKTFEFTASKDIEAGEEIRINYFKGKSNVMELVPPTKLEVRSSEGKGLGVFATEDIASGEILEDCPLKPLGKELSATDVFIDYRFNYPKKKDSPLRVLALGMGAIFNHSDDNNAWWIDHPGLDHVFRFIATKDIKRGEEVCTYYGDSSYWDNQAEKPI